MGILEKLKSSSLMMTWLAIVWNLAYGFFQLQLGMMQDSFWYIALSAFFLILGAAWLMAASMKDNMSRTMRIMAFMMTFLAVIICGITFLTINETVDPITQKHPVFGQAVFAFGMIIAALCSMILSYRRKNSRIIMIRNLSMASALGSMLSLERTILRTTLSTAAAEWIIETEAASGWIVFMILLILAFNLMRTANRTLD